MESKKDIRKRVLENRNLLTERIRKEKNYCIFEKVVNHPFFLFADAVYCYANYKSEVDTCAIIEHALSVGKKVALPKVRGDIMEFYYIRSMDELMEGYKGIPEPESKTLATDETGLMIMPGVAFDTDRNRIGYGKGYYDTYLSIHPDFQTIALAYELQMVETIPTDKHDICPQIVITEENTYE